MGRTFILALRVLLVVILAGALMTQLWYFPVLASQLADLYPELGWLRWPLLTLVIVIIAGVQAVLVALWMLLTMVERDRVFSTDAFRWVDVIIAAAVIDSALVLVAFMMLSFGANANPPGLALLQLALVVCGAAFALLMGVMKGLLRKASSLTAELSEVI